MMYKANVNDLYKTTDKYLAVNKYAIPKEHLSDQCFFVKLISNLQTTLYLTDFCQYIYK